MKRLLVVTNVLLAIIAACLILIVARVDDFTLVSPAHAQSTGTNQAVYSSSPLPVRVVNDSLPCTVEGTVDARMYLNDIGWSPVKGKYGVLSVQAEE